MRAIVRGFVVGTVGLAVLVGSPAVSLAQRPPTARVTLCECTCWYSGGSAEVTFTTDRSCSTYNRRTWNCKDKAGGLHKGELQACKRAPGVIQGEPPAKVPPGGARPPVGPLQKQP
jgi:hypothetical protein